MNRLLCYAPYASWVLHAMWEVTIAHACALRGAEVRYVLCDGVYTDCDIHWAVTRPRTKDSCRKCQEVAESAFKGFSMPYGMIGKYIHPGDHTAAKDWASSIPSRELVNACFNNRPIGRWIESSVHTHLRQTFLDFDNPAVAQTYRSYLYSGALASEGLSRLLDDFRPDTLLLFNGRMSSLRIAFELARARGVRVVLHERGNLVDTLALSENALFGNYENANKVWETWKDVPLTTSEMEKVRAYFENRRRGRGLNWHSYIQSTGSVAEKEFRAALGLRPNSRVTVLFTTSEDEIIAGYDRSLPLVYPRQIDWVRHTIEIFKDRPQDDLVLRLHPNTAGKLARLGSNTQDLETFINLKASLPKNVRMVMPDEPVDSYALMETANLGLTYGSTVTLEMSSIGKPVIIACHGFFYDRPFAFNLRHRDDLAGQIDRMVSQPSSVETIRWAYRFAHRYFIKQSIPFPQVSVVKVHAGKLNYSCLEDLKPGREENLDRIAEFVLGRAPLIEPPDHRSPLHAEEDEDEFLHRLPLGRWPTPCQADDGKMLKGKCVAGLTSIIVLNLNGGQHIKLCIESIKTWTREPYELIVVDNGSNDGTLEYLQSVEGIKLIQNAANLGAPYGRNQGLAVADGEYIVFLDNDTIVTDGWLKRFIGHANANPMVGIVGPRSNFVSGPQLVPNARYSNLSELRAFAEGWSLANMGRTTPAKRLILFCYFLKREVVEKIGGIDPAFGKWGWEDDDYGLRAQIAGYQLLIANDIYIHHTGSQTSKSAKIDYSQLLQENWRVFREKWGIEILPDQAPTYSPDRLIARRFNPESHAVPIPLREDVEKRLRTTSKVAPDISDRHCDDTFTPAEALYKSAQTLVVQGDEENAIKALENLLESFPDHALAHNDLGVLCCNAGNADEALMRYEKAVQLAPANTTFKKNLADFYYVVQGRVEDALRIYLQVLEIDPHDTETLLAIGHISILLNASDEAKVFVKKALEIDPSNAAAMEMLQRLEDPREGIHKEVPAITSKSRLDALQTGGVNSGEMDPDDSHEGFERHQGNTHRTTASPVERSRKTLIIVVTSNTTSNNRKICIECIKKYTANPYEIAVIKRRVGKRELSIATKYNELIKSTTCEYICIVRDDILVTSQWLDGMQEALERWSNTGIVGPLTNISMSVQQVMGFAYASPRQLDDYARSFRERNRFRFKSVAILDDFCMLFRRSMAESIGFFDEDSRRDRTEEDLCLRAAMEGYRNLIVGDVYVHRCGNGGFMGNTGNAGGTASRDNILFREKLNNTDLGTHCGKRLISLRAMKKADELYQMDKVDEAISAFLEGLKYSSSEKDIYAALAEMLIQSKRFKDALDVLNEMPAEAHDLHREVLIGYCKEGMEIYDQAEEIADRALDIDSTSALALNLKGVLASKRGENAAAERYFEKAILSDPGFGMPYTNLGALKRANGHLEDALEMLERGFVLSPTLMDNATAYHSAASELGEYGRAEIRFLEAAALNPFSRRLKYLYINVLLQQDKYEEALFVIQGLIADHGTDEGILDAALAVREKSGLSAFQTGDGGKANLSLCMIVKNEEKHLARCLNSVQSIVDEIIVVDTGSSDRTKDIARVFGAKVHDFEWTNDFAEARNFSLSLASGRWILVLDADEVVSRLDLDRLRSIVRNGKQIGAYYFTTRNYLNSVNYEGWQANRGCYPDEEKGLGWIPSTKVRLFSNDRRIRFHHKVHELVEPSLKKLGIRIKQCDIPVHHYGKLDTHKATRKDEEYFNLGLKKLNESSTDMNALVELAKAAGGIERYDQAINLWQEVLRRDPHNATAYVDLSYAYFQCRDFQNAMDAAVRAMELNGNLKEAVYNYSLCVIHTGDDLRKAIGPLEKILKRYPDYAPALGMLSTFCILTDQRDKGLALIQRIKKLGFSASDCFYQNARRFMETGRTAEASRLLETAVETDNADQNVLMLLAKHYGRNRPGMEAGTIP